MGQSLLRRIRKLERAQPSVPPRWHLITVHEGEDPEARKAALAASGVAQEGDGFIIRTFVKPPAWEDD